MSRRVHTADDVLLRARAGASEYVVEPGERLTPLARDTAKEHGLAVVERAVGPSGPPGPAGSAGSARFAPLGRTPPLRHVAGVNVLPLAPFPAEIDRPAMDVRLLDVLTAEHGLPMAAGVMSLREGTFPWQLDYDEIEYVIEGELHIATSGQTVVGRPGDVIAVPRGSAITFGTPSWAKFLYVTYPADWGGAG